MDLVTVSCQHCGAPLKFPVGVMQLACDHCDATVILQTAGVANTTPLRFLPDHLEESLAKKIGLRMELEELDRQWKAEQEKQGESNWSEGMTYGTAGFIAIAGVVLGGLIALSFHVCIGVLAFVFILVQAAIICAGVDERETKRLAYEQKRETLLRQLYPRDAKRNER